MHENGVNEPLNRKRVLTKVRRNFLNKRADEDGLTNNHNFPLNSIEETVHPISPSVGLIQVNGKVLVDAQYFPVYYNMTTTIIEDMNKKRAVMVHLYRKESTIQNNLESITKKLESHGDLELATWAHRIRKSQANYPRIMAEYFELMLSDDPEVFMPMRKAKASAAVKCKDIESQYPYCRIIQFFGRETIKLLSCTYNERFLKEVDHTIESFISWSKKNGLLHFIDNDCPLYIDFAKQVLEGFSLKNGSLYEGPEHSTLISDKNGAQKPAIVQSITILEPSSEGYFLYEYFILKENCTKTPIPKAEQGQKCIKRSVDIKPAANNCLSIAALPAEQALKVERE